MSDSEKMHKLLVEYRILTKEIDKLKIKMIMDEDKRSKLIPIGQQRVR